MIASLPMYDREETRDALDRLWSGIHRRLQSEGIDAPETLNHDTNLMEIWARPDLVLSQTCGLPFRREFRGKVQLVGSPVIGVADGPGGYYYSAFVTRADDPRADVTEFAGATLAINEYTSQSGWGAPLNHAASLGFRFGSLIATGAHRLSAALVAKGGADIAALDILSWTMIQRWDPAAAHLKVIGQTDPTPGPPLITTPDRDADALFDAFAEALAALPPADRDLIGWSGVVRLSPDDYDTVPDPPKP